MPTPSPSAVKLTLEQRAFYIVDVEGLGRLCQLIALPTAGPRCSLGCRTGQMTHTRDLGVEGGQLGAMPPSRQRSDPLTEAEVPLSKVSASADGVASGVRTAHRERVGGATRDNQIHVLGRRRGRLTDLRHGDVKRFLKAGRNRPRNLLGVAKHRFIGDQRRHDRLPFF